jgi:type II secretory pathway component PulF
MILHTPNNNYNLTSAFAPNDDVQQLTSGPVLLANTLAWAVQNNTPLPDAVLSLTKTGKVKMATDLFSLSSKGISLSTQIFPRLLGKANWNSSLHGLYCDLMKGRPLAQSLRRRMKYFLPEYYLQAVARAEQEHTLPQILPAFAKRLNYTSNIKANYAQYLKLPLWEISIITLMAINILIFLNRFMVELLSETVATRPMLISDYLNIIGYHLKYIISWPFQSMDKFIVFSIFILGCIVLWFCFRMQILRNLKKLLIIIPGMRRELYELERLEMLACMASYLDAGEDMLKAAKFCLTASHSFRIRYKLKRFIADLEHGTNWLNSWERLKLGSKLDNLLLNTSSTTDQLLDGFETVLQWNSSQVYRQSKYNRRRIVVAMTLFNTLIVAAIVIGIFQCLIYIVNSETKTTGFENIRELEAMR